MRENDVKLGAGKTPTLLDCTFRDGGYYNNWEFPDELFQNYLDAIDTSQFSMAEVGFRFLPKQVYMGPHAYTSDNYLSTFRLPEKTELGIMVNASDFKGSESLDSLIERLFLEQSNSPLSFVRIASHASEIETAVEVSQRLIQIGYRVAINLMQISEISLSDLPKLLEPVNQLPLFAFYVADSLGSMTPKTSSELFQHLEKITPFKTGIHAHDNLGLALENSLTAVSNGASFVDATILGMGRGPGNTKSEELALALASEDAESQLAVDLGKFAYSSFAEMQTRLGWGRNFTYFLAGQRGVHPSFVQELLADSRFDYSDALQATYELSQLSANRFDRTLLETMKQTEMPDVGGDLGTSRVPRWAPTMVEAALIVGPAELSSTSVRELRLFLESHSPYLSLSINGSFTPRTGDLTYRVVSNPRQATMLSEVLQDPGIPWIAAVDRVGSQLGAFGAPVFDYPFSLADNFKLGDSGVESPIDNVFAYASGLALQSGATSIYIAGFDGLAGADHRNYEMVTLLNILSNQLGVRVVSLTKTSLPVETVSVFSL